EVVGQFALGLAVTAPAIEFANLRLRLIQATDARHEYAFGDYLGLEMTSTLLAVVVIFGLAVSGYRLESLLVIMAIALAKSVENLADVFFGYLQQHDRLDRIARSLMLKGVLSLAALGGAVYLTGSVAWGAAALFAAWVLVLLGYDLRNAVALHRSLHPGQPWTAFVRPRFRRQTLLRLAWLALPLGLATLVVALNANIPRYTVERTLGEAQLGIFAALAYFHRAGTTVVNALGESASPRLSRYLNAGQVTRFNRLLLATIGIGALLGIGGVGVAWIAGESLLTLVYGAEYARRDVFVQLMIASGLAYVATFIFYGLTAARYLRVQTALLVLASVVLLAACWILVPRSGLMGAATAMVIARAVQLLGALLALLIAAPSVARAHSRPEAAALPPD
ncbi:MAG TPA: lipopolysaccharide biosynthesis protein, partial [Anaerolineaceae bacterium]|nr:lipopolysaccharide biosynthesis protein [Anaerolineaceae bacterium]